ncbi:tyrosine-protein kinase transmembrane receptor Ror-like isoform X2 [Zootermopsis nevadensis]|nr:tyrosine-protein kinase transmembrane receptor Ror-like isoform X2 [Zootermopsis nevadensis]XP_021942312.1 tyrosine-protein kinase transmembrane receptor Ror-like isoform X2 [Zootermopsis nevadensis]
MTVAATPKPIHIGILIPPSGANSTARNQTLVQQPDRTIQEDMLPSTNSLVIGMLGLALLAVTVSVTVCLWKRKEISKCVTRSGKSRQSSSGSPSPLSLSKGLLVPNRYTPNPQYSACAIPDTVLVPQLPRDTLCFLQEIGEGCFGKVHKGELRREDGQQPEIVAVKVLKESATREAEEDFMREVDIMSAFRHCNILSLIGVVLRDAGNSPWMVFEFMPHGDLAEVLRSNSRQLWKPVPGLAPLTKESLLSVALQISSGMQYLAAQRFVHRDLACRNCLVGAGLSVKIADFGMSRDVYTCDYYKIGGSRLLPVRWMSPESVMYGRFTLESDVWSYGVVLWEIYSLGKQPYYGQSNEEVVKLILQGIMLIPPEDCPQVIWDLMRSCWKTEPRDRIRFGDIYARLKKAQEEAQESSTNTSMPLPPPMPLFPPQPHQQFASPSLSSSFSCTLESDPLPRPPRVFPLLNLSTKAVELLDSENYLLPQIPPASRCEYLQPLPD